jgi:hypothetical protein
MERDMIIVMNWNYSTIKLQIGEILCLKRLEHNPKAFFATREADLKDEFGLSVALSLILILAIARAGLDWSPYSMLICLLAFVFCEVVSDCTDSWDIFHIADRQPEGCIR